MASPGDRIRAAELICKMTGLLDGVAIEEAEEQVNPYEGLTTEELRALAYSDEDE